jgi:uncharacterized repeat protein (TIGR01451 family)
MKLYALTLLLILTNFCLYSQRWEQTFNQFPVDGECAFGLQATPDGGLLMLGSRGFNGQESHISYLQKIDEDGKIQWKRDLVTSGAIKFIVLSDGNYAMLSRNKDVSDNLSFFYTLFQPNGTIIKTDSVRADGSTDLKAWALAPIHTGLSIGGFVVGARSTYAPSNYETAFLRTYTANGDPSNVFRTYYASDSLIIRDVVQLADGKFYAVGFNHYPFQTDADPVWFKMDDNGHMEPNWVKVWDDTDPNVISNDAFHDIAPTLDGNMWVLGLKDAVLGPDYSQLYLKKINISGEEIYTKFIADHISNIDFVGYDHSKIVPLPDGGAAILFETYVPDITGEDFSLARVDAAGNVLWIKHYGREKRFTESPFDLALMSNGGFALAGWFNDELFETNDAYVIRTDQNGDVYTNHVHGQVYADLNGNCSKESSEPPLAGWLLRLERPGQSTYTTLTGLDGRYTMPADAGTSQVRIIPAANFWQPCQSLQNISMGLAFDSLEVDFGVKKLTDCPQLEVDIATQYLRRCFSSNYTVTYANRGTVNVPNATVKIELDPDLQFLYSNGNWTYLGNNVFEFALGTLEIGQVGTFFIRVKVVCDANLGATHCTKATISPSTTCAVDNWSGASIGVEGNCNNTTIDFRVKNKGSGNITQTVEYIIIEDQVIYRQGQILNLPTNQDTIIKVPANGATWRIETTQEPFHPGNSLPSVAVESCGTDAQGNSSTGFITLFPEDDNDPYVSIDCTENIGSFDPNDKQGLPKGLDTEHFIYPNTDIEYMIRFQNTGTDTAFAVVIKDTLTSLLDVNSIRPGASSHAYTFDIMGENVLKFSFADIMLPDSNVNEELSHGFVKFTAKHRADIQLGSVIRNAAAIYFDFNVPVITNETWHTVDTGFVEKTTISIKSTQKSTVLGLEIYPNPIHNRAWMVLPSEVTAANNLSRNLQIRMVNVQGNLVFEQRFSGEKLLFERKGLAEGVYFLELLDGNEVKAVGKILIK